MDLSKNGGTGWWMSGILAALLIGVLTGQYLPNRNVVTRDDLSPISAQITETNSRITETNSSVQELKAEVSALKGELKGRKELEP